MKRVLAGLTAAALLLGAWDIAPDTSASGGQVGAAAPTYRIVLVGDSILAGAVGGDPDFPSDDAIEAQLAAEFSPDAYTITNVACGGYGVYDWVPSTTDSKGSSSCSYPQDESAYHNQLVPALHADVAVVMIGTNDAANCCFNGGEESNEDVAGLDGCDAGTPNQCNGMQSDDYESFLTAVVEDLEDRASRVLLMTPPKTGNITVRQQLLVEYREAILGLCGTLEHVSCGPDVHELLEQSGGDTTNWDGSDQSHPNAAGTTAISNALIQDLRSLFPGEF